MLTIKKELGFNDFQNEYEDILNDIDYEAQEIIFDSLCDMMYDGAEDMTVRDYIRFQLQISTQSELLENYDIIDDEDMEDINLMEEDERAEKIHEEIEEYLSYHTYYLGSYEDEDGVKVYLHDEF